MSNELEIIFLGRRKSAAKLKRVQKLRLWTIIQMNSALWCCRHGILSFWIVFTANSIIEECYKTQGPWINCASNATLTKSILCICSSSSAYYWLYVLAEYWTIAIIGADENMTV